MPWFRHHFHCVACEGAWLCEHSAEMVADCPYCGARDAFPYKSDDWSEAPGLAAPVARATPENRPGRVRQAGRASAAPRPRAQRRAAG